MIIFLVFLFFYLPLLLFYFLFSVYLVSLILWECDEHETECWMSLKVMRWNHDYSQWLGQCQSSILFSRKVCGNILINYSTIQWWSEYWTSPLFDWWKVAQLLNIWFSDGFWNKTKTITAKMFKFQSRIQKWHLNTVTFQMLSPIENRTKKIMYSDDSGIPSPGFSCPVFETQLNYP